MQSSSNLFPVALISAERRGDLSEDVYRLKPGNSPDGTVELAVTRLGLADVPENRGIPVILLHGSFSNRRFWYSPKGIGLGAYLARQGFDVWIPEMRGHGLSKRNHDYTRNRVADYARYDLPAIGAFVREQSAQIPHWIGHSLGGTSLAAALGGQHLGAPAVASVALFGCQVSRTHWPLKVPPVEWTGRLLLKRFGELSGSRFKRGPGPFTGDTPYAILVSPLLIESGQYTTTQRVLVIDAPRPRWPSYSRKPPSKCRPSCCGPTPITWRWCRRVAVPVCPLQP